MLEQTYYNMQIAMIVHSSIALKAEQSGDKAFKSHMYSVKR